MAHGREGEGGGREAWLGLGLLILIHDLLIAWCELLSLSTPFGLISQNKEHAHSGISLANPHIGHSHLLLSVRSALGPSTSLYELTACTR